MIHISNKELAPVLISVYNRINHFHNCIESLSKNKFADKTILFVAIDAPYRDEVIAGVKVYQKIGFKKTDKPEEMSIYL